MAVDDLPFEAVQYACKQVFRSEHFMPAPAMLRGYAQDWEKRQRLELPQDPAREAMLALRDELVPSEEVRRLLVTIWPEIPAAEPVTDPEARRALLRAQAQQVLQEEAAPANEDGWPIERRG